MTSRLSPLQEDLLRSFFRREDRFFLSGGAALAGFHLAHRETHDLDLFTLDDALDRGMSALRGAAGDLGATIEAIQTDPDFRRVLVRRGGEAIVVDLVREYVVQASVEKPVMRDIRVDPPAEIMANKLCALLSRSEVRDLVDVRALEQAGYSLDEALTLGKRKDQGLTPAQLAWVLSQIEIGPDLIPPGNVSAKQLRDYLAGLILRLTQKAFPSSG